MTEFLDLPWKERSPICRRCATVICTPLLSSVLGIFCMLCRQHLPTEMLTRFVCCHLWELCRRSENCHRKIKNFLGRGGDLFRSTNLPCLAGFPSVSPTPPLQFHAGIGDLRSRLPPTCVWLGVCMLRKQLDFLWTKWSDQACARLSLSSLLDRSWPYPSGYAVLILMGSLKNVGI